MLIPAVAAILNAPVAGNQYTQLVAPLAWRACETFLPHKSAATGTIVTEASDVFMLGCTFIEVLTGCSREPYDWLTAADPSGTALIVYRGHESTRNNNPLVVRHWHGAAAGDGDAGDGHTGRLVRLVDSEIRQQDYYFNTGSETRQGD